MSEQIVSADPVQGELDFKPNNKDGTSHPSPFTMLCMHPDTGVKKDIADVAIPSNN